MSATKNIHVATNPPRLSYGASSASSAHGHNDAAPLIFSAGGDGKIVATPTARWPHTHPLWTLAMPLPNAQKGQHTQQAQTQQQQQTQQDAVAALHGIEQRPDTSNAATSIAYHPGRDMVACVSRSGQVCIIHHASDKDRVTLRRFNRVSTEVHQLLWTPKSGELVVVSDSVRVFSVPSLEDKQHDGGAAAAAVTIPQVRVLSAPGNMAPPYLCVDVSPCERWVAFLSAKGAVGVAPFRAEDVERARQQMASFSASAAGSSLAPQQDAGGNAAAQRKRYVFTLNYRVPDALLQMSAHAPLRVTWTQLPAYPGNANPNAGKKKQQAAAAADGAVVEQGAPAASAAAAAAAVPDVPPALLLTVPNEGGFAVYEHRWSDGDGAAPAACGPKWLGFVAHPFDATLKGSKSLVSSAKIYAFTKNKLHAVVLSTNGGVAGSRVSLLKVDRRKLEAREDTHFQSQIRIHDVGVKTNVSSLAFTTMNGDVGFVKKFCAVLDHKAPETATSVAAAAAVASAASAAAAAAAAQKKPVGDESGDDDAAEHFQEEEDDDGDEGFTGKYAQKEGVNGQALAGEEADNDEHGTASQKKPKRRGAAAEDLKDFVASDSDEDSADSSSSSSSSAASSDADGDAHAARSASKATQKPLPSQLQHKSAGGDDADEDDTDALLGLLDSDDGGKKGKAKQGKIDKKAKKGKGKKRRGPAGDDTSSDASSDPDEDASATLNHLIGTAGKQNRAALAANAADMSGLSASERRQLARARRRGEDFVRSAKKGNGLVDSDDGSGSEESESDFDNEFVDNAASSGDDESDGEVGEIGYRDAQRRVERQHGGAGGNNSKMATTPRRGSARAMLMDGIEDADADGRDEDVFSDDYDEDDDFIEHDEESRRRQMDKRSRRKQQLVGGAGARRARYGEGGDDDMNAFGGGGDVHHHQHPLYARSDASFVSNFQIGATPPDAQGRRYFAFNSIGVVRSTGRSSEDTVVAFHDKSRGQIRLGASGIVRQGVVLRGSLGHNGTALLVAPRPQREDLSPEFLRNEEYEAARLEAEIKQIEARAEASSPASARRSHKNRPLPETQKQDDGSNTGLVDSDFDGGNGDDDDGNGRRGRRNNNSNNNNANNAVADDAEVQAKIAECRARHEQSKAQRRGAEEERVASHAPVLDLYFRIHNSILGATDWSVKLVTARDGAVQNICVGRRFVAVFTSRYLRLFSSTGWETAVIGLPHHVVCATGWNTVKAPAFAQADLLAYVFQEAPGAALKLRVLNVDEQREMLAPVQLPLSMSETHHQHLFHQHNQRSGASSLWQRKKLSWLGWSDDGALCAADESGCVFAHVSDWGGAFQPIYDPLQSAGAATEILPPWVWHVAADDRVWVHRRLADQPFPPVTHDIPVPEVIEKELGVPAASGRDVSGTGTGAAAPTKQQAADYATRQKFLRLAARLNDLKRRSEFYSAEIAAGDLQLDRLALQMFRYELDNGRAAQALELAAHMQLTESIQSAAKMAHEREQQSMREKLMGLLQARMRKKQKRLCALPAEGSVVSEKDRDRLLRRMLAQQQQQQQKEHAVGAPAADAAAVPASIRAPAVQQQQQKRSDNNNDDAALVSMLLGSNDKAAAAPHKPAAAAAAAAAAGGGGKNRGDTVDRLPMQYSPGRQAAAAEAQRREQQLQAKSAAKAVAPPLATAAAAAAAPAAAATTGKVVPGAKVTNFFKSAVPPPAPPAAAAPAAPPAPAKKPTRFVAPVSSKPAAATTPPLVANKLEKVQADGAEPKSTAPDVSPGAGDASRDGASNLQAPARVDPPPAPEKRISAGVVAAAPATSTPPRKSVTFSQVADIILPETQQQQPPAPAPVVFADFRSNLPAKAVGDSAANLRAAAGAALDSDGAAAAANKSDAFKQSLDAQFNARVDSDDDQGYADPALQSLLKF